MAHSALVKKINTYSKDYNAYSCNSFTAFIDHITTNNLFSKVRDKDRFVLSFGGGGQSAPSFPLDLFTSFESITYIFAFDTEFKKSSTVANFLHYVSKTSKIRGRKIELYTIATTVPEVNDIRQLAKNTYTLQQESSTFLYYAAAKCSLTNSEETNTWVSQFTNLIKMINETGQNVFIVNDAWWDQKNVFGGDINAHTKLSIKNIQHFGRNFEALCVIPKTLLSNMDVSKLFMIVPSADNAPIPFTEPGAVHKYNEIETGGLKFTSPENLNYIASFSNKSNNSVAACGGAGGECLAAPPSGGSRRRRKTRRGSRRVKN